ncbi:MAG: hypothetical protein Fur005_26060 [Roseiflexaceae bacterium]
MNLETIAALLQLLPVQRAMLALLIAGATLPIAGVWIIGLNIVPVRFAMMHVALLGIAIGFLLGIDPALTGLLLCGLTGVAMAPLATRPGGLGNALGLVMTLVIALALLVLSVSGVNANLGVSLPLSSAPSSWFNRCAIRSPQSRPRYRINHPFRSSSTILVRIRSGCMVAA